MEANSSTSSSKLVKQIAVLLLLLFIADYAVGYGLRWLFYHTTIGWEPMIIESVEKTEDEIIIFGSSYANSQYDSKVFEDETSLTCYNAGVPGQSLIYATAVQECMLTRYTPKIFIVDISPKDIVYREEKPDYLRLNVLLPFVKKYPIGDIVYKRSKYERFKTLSQIYPFNSMILTFIFNWGKTDNFYKGYQPFDTELTKERYDEYMNSSFGAELERSEDIQLDSFKVEMLRRFMKNSREHGVRTIFVVSPKIFQYGADYLFDFLEKEIRKGGCEYVDWKHREDFQTLNEYRDIHHLNRKGATRFSTMLAREIMEKR